MQSRVSNNNLYGENLKYGTYTEQTVPGGSLLRGEVIRNDDPQSMGRVKVMIPSIYHGMPEDQIPWAPVLQMGAGGGAGSMIVPEVGTIAVCSFEGGRYDKPIVVGTAYGTGSTGARQISNTVHCQNAPGAMGTANNRTIENPETPVQGQNLNTPVLYKSHNGSYIQFDNTTGNDDISMVGSSGDYIIVGSNRIAMETSAGEDSQTHGYTGSHLFLNDDDPEVQEAHGAQVELGSKGGFSINMNDKLETMTITNKKGDQKITVTQEGKMMLQYTKGHPRELVMDDSGINISANESMVKVNDNGIYIYLGNNSVNVTKDSVVIHAGDTVRVEASSLIDLQAPTINLGD